MPVLWIRGASTQNCEVEENPNIEVQGGTLTHVQKKLSAFYACRAISLIASTDDICQSALLQVALTKQIPELWTNRGQEMRWKTGTASPWLHKWSDYFHATTWFIIGADKKKKSWELSFTVQILRKSEWDFCLQHTQIYSLKCIRISHSYLIDKPNADCCVFMQRNIIFSTATKYLFIFITTYMNPNFGAMEGLQE